MTSSESRPSIPDTSWVVMTTAVVPSDKKEAFSNQAEKIIGQLGESVGLLHQDVHLDEEPDGSIRVSTVTVWQSGRPMLDFVKTGAHKDAVLRADDFVIADTFRSQRITGADVGGVLPTKETVIAAFKQGPPAAPQQRAQ